MRYMYIYIRKPLMGIFKKGRLIQNHTAGEVTQWRKKRKTLKKEKNRKAKVKRKERKS